MKSGFLLALVVLSAPPDVLAQGGGLSPSLRATLEVRLRDRDGLPDNVDRARVEAALVVQGGAGDEPRAWSRPARPGGSRPGTAIRRRGRRT